MAGSSRRGYILAALFIIALGLFVRRPGLGLPSPIAKNAGSTLWGVMVFAVVRALAP